MRLEVSGVHIAIGAKRIVHDLTLTVGAGEIVGLIGPNGSGKSTLLRSVYRTLRPSAGLLKLGEDDIWRLSSRESARRTGVVVQEHGGEFEFTVLEIVAMGRNPHKGALERDTVGDANIIGDALMRVSMLEFQHRQFSTLSGGEKQRVIVARALAQQPRLLVLDEPTNHLDIHHQLELLELVRGLGVTTLVTLHDLNLAAAYCSRLYLLEAGRIVSSGPPEVVLTPDLLARVFKVSATPSRHPVTHALQLSFSPLEHRLETALEQTLEVV